MFQTNYMPTMLFLKILLLWKPSSEKKPYLMKIYYI